MPDDATAVAADLQEFKVGDTTYKFPKSFSDDKVKGILTSQGVIKGPASPDMFMPHKSDMSMLDVLDRKAGKPKQTKDNVPPAFQGPMGGGEPPDTAGAILPAFMAGATVAIGGTGAATAINAGGKAAAKYGIQAARDLATAYIAGEGVSRGLKKIGVNGVLADIGGLLAGAGAAGTLEQMLGKDTLEKLAAAHYEEVYGRAPKTAAEKLQARGLARRVVNEAAKSPKTPKAFNPETAASAPEAMPPVSADTPKPKFKEKAPKGAAPAAEGSSYSFTHPKESLTDVRKQLFSNTQQLTIPNDQVRVRFTQLHGHGISAGTYEEIQQFNEYIAKNGKLPLPPPKETEK